MRHASRRVICLFLWGVSGGCATYENTQPDDNGALGNAGAETGGVAGTTPNGGSSAVAGSSSGSGGLATGGVATSGSAGMSAGMGGAAGGKAGAGGLGAGGASGHAGAGGVGGLAGSGGKASGGSGGAGGKASGGSSGSGGSAGSSGSGGSSATQTCAKNPIPAKSKWVVTASSSSNADPVGNAHDGVLTNRWSTGKDQVGGEWLQLDFGAVVTLTKLTLALGASGDDYPRKYATRFSNTSANQTAPVLVSGMGAKGTDTVMTFPAGTSGRYVLISQSGAAPTLWWSVAEIQAECAD